ncbi:hypothetical protein LQ944_02570 [Staphylococcus pasteuri]|uniref:hypothetical protein n=1 Tax=Staphylococcus pasteuri TaxID=45972 RepID=UPI001E36BEFF|nr:hypothetical protein [Staphylococcus pasteuri]MCD9066005.1 hypothetical protein [Staphylococcus pasteuri]WAE41308.1 hypothetical protein LQ944_02570 [Staphylococcus pasteuri]
MKFEDRFLKSSNLVKHQKLHDGVQYIFKGSQSDTYYSVVRHHVSYGHERGLYELAKCVQVDGINQVIEEPIGWLSIDEVLEKVEQEND